MTLVDDSRPTPASPGAGVEADPADELVIDSSIAFWRQYLEDDPTAAGISAPPPTSRT